MVYGLYQFARIREKSADAIQTTAYIVGYPICVLLFSEYKPIEPALAVPLVMAGWPWLLAGVHLNDIIKDPTAIKQDELVGFPKKLWIWGAVISVAIGAIFG